MPALSGSSGVRVERRERIEFWWLDRPERRNALDLVATQELHRLALAADQDPDLHAVVIIGAGDKAFCAGADLKERAQMSDAEVLEQLSAYRGAFDAIDQLSKPTIAAINGVALGGGFELALCCDFRLIVADAEVGLPEVSLAVIPGAGGTQRLTRLVGPGRAKEMILLSQRLGATEALAAGLVHRVVSPEQNVVDFALQFAAAFVQGPALAYAAALRAIDAAQDGSLGAGLEIERRCYEQVLQSHDRREALEAFQVRRAPRFTGS